MPSYQFLIEINYNYIIFIYLLMKEEYVSIFDQMRNFEALKSKEEKKSKKKVKLEQKDPQEYNVEISITDHQKLQNMTFVTMVQNFIRWTFIKDQMNPLWVSIKNKHLIKHAVILSAPINAKTLQDLITRNELALLSRFNEKTQVSSLKPIRDSQWICNELFWDNLLGSKFQKQLYSQSKENVQKEEKKEIYLTYHQKIWHKYNQFILDDPDLDINNYPNDQQELYENYRNTLEIVPQNVDDRFNIFAIDCEMVQTEKGLQLARVTMIDFEFNEILNELVLPSEPITNYNTQYSGITEELLKDVKTTLKEVQDKILSIIDQNSILIGHSLENDLRALEIIHLKVIDTSVLFSISNGRKIKLKELSAKHFNSQIQQETHDSTEDAKAALSLAKLRVDIFSHIQSNFFNKKASTLDLLKEITDNRKTFLPLDIQSNIQQTIKCKKLIKDGAHFDVLSDNSKNSILNSISKWLTLQSQKNISTPNLMIGRIQESEIEDNEKYIKEFDDQLNTIYFGSPKNTLFILVSQDENKHFETPESFAVFFAK